MATREFERNQCHWWLADYPEPGVVLAIVDDFDAWQRDARVPIPAIGDEAWWNRDSNMLLTRVANVAFLVRIDGIYEYVVGDLDGLAATRRIAEIAARRINE